MYQLLFYSGFRLLIQKLNARHNKKNIIFLWYLNTSEFYKEFA